MKFKYSPPTSLFVQDSSDSMIPRKHNLQFKAKGPTSLCILLVLYFCAQSFD